MAAGRAVLPDGEKTRQEPCRFLSRVRFAREILRRSFGVDGVDQAVERLRRKDLGEKNEKLVVCADGVERVVRALPERDLGNVSARLGGIHAGLLVVLHARDRAGNAAAVNVVALTDLAPRGGEAGVDVTGHDGADGDAEGTQLVGKRHGVGVDGSLGGRVIRLKGNGDRGRHGAEIYDPAATGLPHDGDYGAVHVHHAEKVDVEEGLGIGGGGELNGTGDAEACVVHENVNTAFGIHDLRYGSADGVLGGDVCCDVMQPLHALRAAGKFVNGTAGGLQGEGGGLADAGSPAGDNSDLIHEKVPPR